MCFMCGLHSCCSFVGCSRCFRLWVALVSRDSSWLSCLSLPTCCVFGAPVWLALLWPASLWLFVGSLMCVSFFARFFVARLHAERFFDALWWIAPLRLPCCSYFCGSFATRLFEGFLRLAPMWLRRGLHHRWPFVARSPCSCGVACSLAACFLVAFLWFALLLRPYSSLPSCSQVVRPHCGSFEGRSCVAHDLVAPLRLAPFVARPFVNLLWTPCCALLFGSFLFGLTPCGALVAPLWHIPLSIVVRSFVASLWLALLWLAPLWTPLRRTPLWLACGSLLCGSCVPCSFVAPLCLLCGPFLFCLPHYVSLPYGSLPCCHLVAPCTNQVCAGKHQYPSLF